jgi:CheY-like chemotaxis protein
MPVEILVVDDNPLIRLFLASVLPRFGFAVRAAATGEEALDLYRRHGEGFSLVLLDVEMPGLDGPQTLAALRELNPSVRCCLMSSGAHGYTPQQLRELGAIAFLQKPFGTPEAFVWALRECLGGLPLSA